MLNQGHKAPKAGFTFIAAAAAIYLRNFTASFVPMVCHASRFQHLKL
jgi:hypothetical protein